MLAVRLAPELSRETALGFLAVIFIVWSAGVLAAFVWVAQDWSRVEEWGLYLLIAAGSEFWLVRSR